ncbi:MAG: MqnA/MqnD/SBP family protein [Oligoflexales bacterium]
MNLAISVCPNDIFVFAGLLLNKVSHSLKVSAYPIGKLNKLLLSGSYDFIKASSIVMIRNENYQVIRVGASLVREKGPQLIRRRNPVFRKIVGVPSLNSTAALLAKKYYPQLEQRIYPLKELSNLVADGDLAYAVIINEDMNRLEELGLESICDLGLRWNEENSAALPLGLFGAHSRLSFNQIDNFEQQVDRSVQWARCHPQEAIKLSQSYAGEAKINATHIQLFTKDAHFNPQIPHYVEKLSKSLNL